MLAGNLSAIQKMTAVAGVRNSVENPWLYLNTNTTGTLNMLEYCRLNQVPKFILASTSSLYGSQGNPPHGEDNDTDHPLQPMLAYHYHHTYVINMPLVDDFDLSDFFAQYPMDDVIIIGGNNVLFLDEGWTIQL